MGLLQGMVAPHPTSAMWGGRGGARRLGWNKGDKEKGCQKQMCAPPPFLNKSCSKSFYLHMLTGTSEFPEERCKEKKMERKREKEKELCLSLLQKA